MDGYGVAPPGPGNAIAAAHTPVLDGLFARWPNTRLVASGEAVGLPAGQMGNSEVGHLAIGAGRVVYQELTRISRAIEDGSFFRNEALIAAIDAALATQGAVHLMGLLSDGGVHSHREHLYALVRLARARGAERIFVHCFLDGRDVAPDSGAGFIEDLESFLGVGAERQGRVASVMGRYWAMDRDNRWERVEKAWNALVVGQGVQAANAREAVEASYAAGVTDEFVAPTVIMDGHLPVGRVCDGDAVIFFNFRPDRARQLTRAFVDPEFAGFPRTRCPAVHFVSLTEYDPKLPAPVAFEKDLPACVLADVLAANGLRQLHIAETEKYAHVTFFLNGGVEAPKRGEERVLVPSPHVATYDLQPEMSAPEVTAELVAAIDEGRADVYIVNYANCDMVGHTGVLAAAVKAVEVVDESLGKVVAAVERRAGALVVTADHGNAERMLDADGTRPFTAHTSAEVPLIVIDDRVRALVRGGMLPDVAPTVLDLLGIEPPDEWTARSLLI
ncbi:MAG TPA: 2,3-bisphosphoglycerate-independent phosphoglycerate mutase, partial [Coriobacteriia bacterium]|nr:2,3-bisphosphoglycerate-independent phosphoglycerate mutase [Coriobacteriia bacterium]